MINAPFGPPTLLHTPKERSEEANNNKKREKEGESVQDKGRGNERGEHTPSPQAPWSSPT